jgi:hypothetical protein
MTKHNEQNENKKMIDIDVDSETDYKKMSLGKLRVIVSEKGLSNVADIAKMKKGDILKLLSVENV